MGAFVRLGDWDIQGYASPVQSLKDQAGMCGDDAYRIASTARPFKADLVVEFDRVA